MGVFLIVTILIIITLYLIVLSSNKARKLKQEELTLIMKLIENSELKDKCKEELAKMNTSRLYLILKVFISKQEIRRLKETNADLREEHNSYVLLKYDYETTLRNTVMDLLDLQDINSLEISEEEKNKNRNVIINKIIKDFNNKINELDELTKTSSS